MTDTVFTALVSVSGALLASLIVGGIQFFVAKNSQKNETNRLRLQLNVEIRSKNYAAWRSQFVDVISELLFITDPECSANYEKDKVVRLIWKAQLLLNLNNEKHKVAEMAICQLGMTVNGWKGRPSREDLFNAQTILYDAVKRITSIQI